MKNEKNMFYASVTWRQPTSSDNSGFHPIVTSVPVVNSPMLFKIGITDIRVITFYEGNVELWIAFFARKYLQSYLLITFLKIFLLQYFSEDLTGNKDFCIFSVTVKGETK